MTTQWYTQAGADAAIAVETSRATAAEGTNASAITAEATARAAAITALAGTYAQRANNLSDVADLGSSRANIHVPLLASCQAVATANQALAGLPTLDGYTAVSGDQVLLTAQTTASQNGPWVVATGAWTRPTDYATGLIVRGRMVQINAGATYGSTVWMLATTTTVTVDTTSTSWIAAVAPMYFMVDNYASDAAAYSALVTAGGGYLVYTRGKTYTQTAAVTLNAAVQTHILAYGATINPASGAQAFIFNETSNAKNQIHLEGGIINCSGVSSGIEIVDHYGAKLTNVVILNPTTGILITDSAHWSESSQFDNVYIYAPTTVGIDFVKTGGTGSFGYANWGLVHIDSLPAGAIGVRWGAGTGFSESTIGRLIVHTSAANATAIWLTGDIGLNTRMNWTLECLSAQTGQVGWQIDSAGTASGSDLRINFIGGWATSGTYINNPSTRPYEAVVQYSGGPRNMKVGGSSTLATTILQQFGNLGDANAMFSMAADGTLRWGPGGASATDTTLQRSGSGFLSTPGAFQVGGNLTSVGGFRMGTGISTSSGTLSTSASAEQDCNASGGAITKTLFNTTTTCWRYEFTKTDSSANTVTISPPGGGTINGSSSSIVLSNQGDSVVVKSTATSGAWVRVKFL